MSSKNATNKLPIKSQEVKNQFLKKAGKKQVSARLKNNCFTFDTFGKFWN
jgi:hypothetical protein